MQASSKPQATGQSNWAVKLTVGLTSEWTAGPWLTALSSLTGVIAVVIELACQAGEPASIGPKLPGCPLKHISN